MTRSDNLRAPLDRSRNALQAVASVSASRARRARRWLLGMAAIPLAASPVWAATQAATSDVPPPAAEAPAVAPVAPPPAGEATAAVAPEPAAVAAAAPAPSPMPWPGMTAGLAANPHPATFSAGPLGDITVDGVLSGFAMTQSHRSFDFFGKLNHHSYG